MSKFIYGLGWRKIDMASVTSFTVPDGYDEAWSFGGLVLLVHNAEGWYYFPPTVSFYDRAGPFGPYKSLEAAKVAASLMEEGVTP